MKSKKLVRKSTKTLIAEGLEDIKKGRVYGPFRSAREMVRALHRRRRPKKA